MVRPLQVESREGSVLLALLAAGGRHRRRCAQFESCCLDVWSVSTRGARLSACCFSRGWFRFARGQKGYVVSKMACCRLLAARGCVRVRPVPLSARAPRRRRRSAEPRRRRSVSQPAADAKAKQAAATAPRPTSNALSLTLALSPSPSLSRSTLARASPWKTPGASENNKPTPLTDGRMSARGPRSRART